MAKFTKKSPVISEEIFPVIEDKPLPIGQTRCGGCAFFLTKLDPNNPFDGFCHALPPRPTSIGFQWAKTASNEFGCSLFRKRG